MDTRLLNMPETRENQRYKPTMPLQRLQMLHHARLALQKIHEEEHILKSSKTNRKLKKNEKPKSLESNRVPWLKPYEAKNPNYPAAREVIDKNYPNTPFSERYDFYDKDGLFEAKKAKRRGNNNRLGLRENEKKIDHVIPKTSMATKTRALKKNYWFDDRKKVKGTAPMGSKGTFFGLSNY